MKRYKFLPLLFLILFPVLSHAVEPPHVPVEKAIKEGYVSFIGKIIRIEETEEAEYWSTAVADVEVIQTFYGITAEKGQIVKVNFYSRLYTEIPYPGQDIKFSVSEVILFVFNRPIEKDARVVDFNSYWNHPQYKDRKIDLAYKAFEGPGEAYSPARDEHSFISAYGISTRYDVRTNDLFKWAEDRAAELANEDE